MPHNGSPIVKYIVRHPDGIDARIRACVHFITYGTDYGKTEAKDFNDYLTLDLSHHRLRPHLPLDRLTGQDRELADGFFSIEENDSTYHESWDRLVHRTRTMVPGGCVAFLINCTAGRHRSVAMAERLARKVGNTDGFKAECLHLDLGRAKIQQAENAARENASGRPRDEPSRSRSRSRHRTQATSSSRQSETRDRRAATTANAMLHSRETPLREKGGSWPTRPVRDTYPRQRETASRSVDSWRESDIRSSRLSS